uniref:(northern house mosquito) hypothetical protein n=1 Tax=Culex pipiens TaxID=7175 RepID=A0A8D8BVU0_CULPI
MFSQTRIMELPGLLGLLGITRITLELLSKSGITELLAQIPSNSRLMTSLTRCWKPLDNYYQPKRFVITYHRQHAQSFEPAASCTVAHLTYLCWKPTRTLAREHD